MHINIQWQKITLYPKSKSISGLRAKLDQTGNISQNLEVPWALQGLWETKKLISCVPGGYTRKAAGTVNQLLAKM